MSDFLAREFRAQLITTMDSVLKRAMFEIMNIFENSLHGHQMELAQKGEEIAELKVKLQRVEVKLTEREYGHAKGVEKNKMQINESPRELGNVNASGQTSDVPEIDFEVPDDWCAPLGCETVTKKEDTCPSVRLRQLHIPLWHIPVIKKEADSHRQRKGGRRSKRISSLKESEERSAQISDINTRQQPVRHDMEKLLQEIKPEHTDVKGRPKGRRRERNSTGKEQVKTQKNKKITASECIEQEAVEHVPDKKYSCKVCMKVFDTQFGLSVHVRRSHRRCRGCKKDFSFHSALKSHKSFCAKLKKLLAKEAQSTDPRKPPPSSSLCESVQKNGSTKKHSCSLCNKEFKLHYKLKEHMRLHTGERPYPCSICPMKFRISQSLRKHIMRKHKGQVDSSVINSLSWTVPLEVVEDQQDLTSPSTHASREIKRNKLQRECNPDRMQSRHICDTAKFNSHGQLSVRKGKCGNSMIKCDKCEKRFPSQLKLDRHVYKYHMVWPHPCKVCGKGFVLQGRLRNHMQCHM